MVPAPIDDEKIARLKQVYRHDEAARAVCDLLASRARNASISPVDRIVFQTSLGRGQVIEVFRLFEQLKFGKFIVGRRGQPSRFEWTVAMSSVGRVATGETHELSEEGIEDIEDVEEAELVEHQFRLRHDLSVRLELPANLTQAEAMRLAEFVKTLPIIAD